jgi:hypothetical protein
LGFGQTPEAEEESEETTTALPSPTVSDSEL